MAFDTIEPGGFNVGRDRLQWAKHVNETNQLTIEGLEGSSRRWLTVTSGFLHWMCSTIGMHAGWCSIIDAVASVMRTATVAGVGIGSVLLHEKIEKLLEIQLIIIIRRFLPKHIPMIFFFFLLTNSFAVIRNVHQLKCFE